MVYMKVGGGPAFASVQGDARFARVRAAEVCYT
jgi:hypothetical protein